MTEQELIDWCEEQADLNHYLEFPEELFSALPTDIAQNLVKKFGRNTLIKLPKREVEFFEWLLENDREVWEDLWGGTEEEPYVVSISFLPLLLDKTRGFPICDLIGPDNYYFTEAHFVDKESEHFIESVKKRFLEKEELPTHQMLTLEITIAPIDIWRFAYRHKVEVHHAKKAVKQLVDDKILVHLTEAEHLANFIDI